MGWWGVRVSALRARACAPRGHSRAPGLRVRARPSVSRKAPRNQNDPWCIHGRRVCGAGSVASGAPHTTMRAVLCRAATHHGATRASSGWAPRLSPTGRHETTNPKLGQRRARKGLTVLAEHVVARQGLWVHLVEDILVRGVQGSVVSPATCASGSKLDSTTFQPLSGSIWKTKLLGRPQHSGTGSERASTAGRGTVYYMPPPLSTACPGLKRRHRSHRRFRGWAVCL